MMIPPFAREMILQHAAACYPRESCGLLVVADGALTYVPCRNLADGEDHFIQSPEDYLKAERLGVIVGQVHSHPDEAAPIPSMADRHGCEASGLPWHIVSWPAGQWSYLEPEGYVLPLCGRPFVHGVLDCYSLIRDWFRLVRAVALPDFSRADKWWETGGNLYLENFEKAGFRCVKAGPIAESDLANLQIGDGLLMKLESGVPNHAALYMGNNKILHHLHGRLSSEDLYNRYFQRHTTHLVRFDASQSHSIGGAGPEVRA